MITSNSFEIKKYNFNSEITQEISSLGFSNDLWPIVYILSHGNEKIAYVGETTDAVARMNAHLKNNMKSKLTEAHLIESELFNKSATLDIESRLIQYISGDGQYQLLNGNIGLANHSYYQKDNVYWGMFTSIWDNLRSLGITKHSIEHIDNSDLFKYSPYKSLSSDQVKGLEMIIDGLLDQHSKNIIIEGGAGTGKSILAVFLFKLIKTDLTDFNFSDIGSDESAVYQKIRKLKVQYPDPKMALVIPMASFRKTLQKVFSKIKGLKASMVIGPSDVSKSNFDILLVDEAHRLKRRRNIVNYKSFDDACKRLGVDSKTSTELDWIQMQSNSAIYFYDSNQSIKPSDVPAQQYQSFINRKDSVVKKLTSQFRSKGGNGYVDFVKSIFDPKKKNSVAYQNDQYEVQLFDALPEMIAKIKQQNEKYGLSRLIAGFSWRWISKNDKAAYDIEIEGTRLRWNSEAVDWINSPNSLQEVGCIHTTQGYDLNYAGIIFGNEIGYNSKNNEIVIRRDQYHDKNGANGIKDLKELKDFIINIYKTMMLRGIRGTYIYVCDPSLRAYIASHLKSELSDTKEEDEAAELVPYVNSIPLYDLKAAAGSFSELQIVEDHQWVAVPPEVKLSKDLFACKVVGESMNRIIPNNSICLFRQYKGGSRNGKIVLVQSSEIQDSEMGSGYTVKEYYSKKMVNDSGWEHQSIILKAQSNDSDFEEIELDPDGLESFNVIGIFERVLE